MLSRSLCCETERWFTERGRTRIPTELRQHILSCKECRSEYSDALPLRQLLGSPSPEECQQFEAAREPLRASIMTQIALETVPVRRSERRFAWRGAAAAVAAVAVGALIVLQVVSPEDRWGQRDPEFARAALDGATAEPGVSEEPNPVLVQAPTVGQTNGPARIDADRAGAPESLKPVVDRDRRQDLDGEPPFLVGIEPPPPRSSYILVVETKSDEVLEF